MPPADANRGPGAPSLRVLFVNRMASMERGGGETFDLEISRHLAALGCSITVLSGRPLLAPVPRPIQIREGDQVLRTSVTLRTPYLPWFPWDKVKGGWRIRVWEFQQFEKKAARWITRHQSDFDIIQICELPYLVSLLNPKSEIRNSKFPKIVMRLTAPNIHDPWGGAMQADALMASGTSIEKIRRQLRADCHDIPNAVDIGRFTVGSSSFRAQVRIPADTFVCLYVARFQAFKNHALLLQAMARLPKDREYRLVLAGSGPLLRATESLARELGLAERVHFLGEVNYQELPEIYVAADLKVISSDYESFCFAALEAMASGLSIVTTDCGWVPGLIGDVLPPLQKQWVDPAGDLGGRFAREDEGQRIRAVPGGLVVGRGDAASLAQAIVQLADHPQQREEGGRWNRVKAEREHGWDSSAQKLRQVYRTLLAPAG